ncbi:carbamate kinase [Pseudodesulfovibrio senegalensis]|uniref:Carbamate kinase n=1 Tax=Pseudodesulfovibrio senegalensis TaxID=1721087 RepID=A0A6N6N5G6_9BACT|nr:carbamate kinase [Pseudodesulfovibrio senegalensis]KAB1443133.1 carbamate kinase [Pseudodesulfovibrio senegalensis]
MARKLAVVAMGGNSLIRDPSRKSVEDQYEAVTETVRHIAELIAAGYQVVITHGNGPQVGFIMLRSELARQYAGLHMVPLVSCVADTQGAIGYQIQQALANELRRRGLDGQTATVVTQVTVDPADPGFADPSKPVGEFYEAAEVDELKKLHPDWILKEDSGRGFRRVVPSPKPVDIVETPAVRTLLKDGFHVVTAGGGGIPVIDTDQGLLGVDAVIDKDLATGLLATKLGAPLLVISTAVPSVALNFGTPEQKNLGTVSVDEMQAYLDQGHFAPGSMAPKVQAALDFIRAGGEKVIITDPQTIGKAINDGAGTHIVP